VSLAASPQRAVLLMGFARHRARRSSGRRRPRCGERNNGRSLRSAARLSVEMFRRRRREPRPRLFYVRGRRQEGSGPANRVHRLNDRAGGRQPPPHFHSRRRTSPAGPTTEGAEQTLDEPALLRPPRMGPGFESKRRALFLRRRHQTGPRTCSTRRCLRPGRFDFRPQFRSSTGPGRSSRPRRHIPLCFHTSARFPDLADVWRIEGLLARGLGWAGFPVADFFCFSSGRKNLCQPRPGRIKRGAATTRRSCALHGLRSSPSNRC